MTSVVGGRQLRVAKQNFWKARFNPPWNFYENWTLMLLRRVKELNDQQTQWNMKSNLAFRETTRMTLDNDDDALPMAAWEVAVVAVAMRRVRPMAASPCLRLGREERCEKWKRECSEAEGPAQITLGDEFTSSFYRSKHHPNLSWSRLFPECRGVELCRQCCQSSLP